MKQVEEERAAKREKRKAAIERQHKRQRQLLRPDPTHRAPLERQLKKVATRGGTEHTTSEPTLARHCADPLSAMRPRAVSRLACSGGPLQCNS